MYCRLTIWFVITGAWWAVSDALQACNWESVSSSNLLSVLLFAIVSLQSTNQAWDFSVQSSYFLNVKTRLRFHECDTPYHRPCDNLSTGQRQVCHVLPAILVNWKLVFSIFWSLFTSLLFIRNVIFTKVNIDFIV